MCVIIIYIINILHRDIMTAEIAILNKEAIAMAADSAVTMTEKDGQKIFTSANKLFALSNYHPVGIMVYGNANFMHTPWETIINIYRKKLGKKEFNKLENYSEDFLNFLDNEKGIFSKELQENSMYSKIYDYMGFIKRTILKKIDSQIEENGITEDNIKKIVNNEINFQFKIWETSEYASSISKDFEKELEDKYGLEIDDIIIKVFEKLIMEKHKHKLKKICISLFTKFPISVENPYMSGVVVAGFGKNDIFPALESYQVECKINDKLKYNKLIRTEINQYRGASIIPFAQREMVATFMEGIDPYYRQIEESFLSNIFNEYADIIGENIKHYNNYERKKLKSKLKKMGNEIVEDHIEKLAKVRKKKYISPITKVVSMLPKDELAAMAESLVNLTSFKRKVSMEVETVGGPIDVAIISKNEGFVWIKRKHYFDKEINPRYFSNYYIKEMSHETKEQ